MPLFYPPAPTPFVLCDPTSLAAGSSPLPAAGSAYLVGYLLYAQVTVTQMRTDLSGSPTGNVDMGIYDATGTNGAPNNLLGHTGAIAATVGTFTQNLTANLVLPPGRYWLALVDTATDSMQWRSTNAAGMGPYYKTSATNLTVLPATLGSLGTVNVAMAIEALLLNNFS